MIFVWIIGFSLIGSVGAILLAGAGTILLLHISPILFDYGVNILSGARVIDEGAVLRTVGQGASFRQVEGVKLLTFIQEKERK